MSTLSAKGMEKFLPAKEVAELVGYTPDYVSRLAREGKVAAERRSRGWFVDPESVKLFLLTAEKKKRSRNDQIRDERLRERARFHNEVAEAEMSTAITQTQSHALLQTVAVSLCLFIAASLVWFSVEENVRIARIAAGADEVVVMLKDRILSPIPAVISQVASYAFITQTQVHDEVGGASMVTSDTADSRSSDFQGVILVNGDTATQERIDELKESFSDEVRVEFENDETGLITPVFREVDGDSFRFLLVPVHQE